MYKKWPFKEFNDQIKFWRSFSIIKRDGCPSYCNNLIEKKMTKAVADIGLIGLAVMGQNLVLNMDDHGYTVCAYNRTVSKVDDFLKNEAKGTKVIGAKSIEEFCASLKSPRKIILLVKAGAAVDAFIDSLLPFCEKGDIIIGTLSKWVD
jgi:6-phosphogluconate dehydrogenase